MKRSFSAVPVLALFLVAAACENTKEPPRGPGGEFGIFFGGQIQERRDVPFELDRTKQLQGFRVELPAPLARDVLITWQLDRPRERFPGKAKGGTPPSTSSEPPAEKPGPPRAVLRAGETRFDQELPFEPGDPLGVWNIRVIADGKVVIDRPFEVYDPAARARAASDAGR